MLVVLLLLALYASYVFFERFLALRKERAGGERLMREVEAALRRGQLSAARWRRRGPTEERWGAFCSPGCPGCPTASPPWTPP